MHPHSTPFTDKPTTVDGFIRCIIGPGWDPGVAFDMGSKQIISARPALVRDAITALRERTDLTRYTHALTRIVDLADDDAALRAAWKRNLTHLRALLFTSPIGTDRQRARLLEIAQNRQVVKAMLYALGKELEPQPRRIEPTWVAVMYAEGSSPCRREADRFNAFLAPDLQAQMRGYSKEGAA